MAAALNVSALPGVSVLSAYSAGGATRKRYGWPSSCGAGGLDCASRSSAPTANVTAAASAIATACFIGSLHRVIRLEPREGLPPGNPETDRPGLCQFRCLPLRRLLVGRSWTAPPV